MPLLCWCGTEQTSYTKTKFSWHGIHVCNDMWTLAPVSQLYNQQVAFLRVAKYVTVWALMMHTVGDGPYVQTYGNCYVDLEQRQNLLAQYVSSKLEICVYTDKPQNKWQLIALLGVPTIPYGITHSCIWNSQILH